MNQKQKQLAEKAIKLRYNGLIEALRAGFKRKTPLNLPNITVKVQSYWEETSAEHYPHDLKRAVDSLIKQGTKVASAIQKENAKREKAFKKERDALSKVISQLSVARDEAILKVHFDGGGEEMTNFYDRLPTPADVLAMLADRGLELAETARLPESIDLGLNGK